MKRFELSSDATSSDLFLSQIPGQSTSVSSMPCYVGKAANEWHMTRINGRQTRWRL